MGIERILRAKNYLTHPFVVGLRDAKRLEMGAQHFTAMDTHRYWIHLGRVYRQDQKLDLGKVDGRLPIHGAVGADCDWMVMVAPFSETQIRYHLRTESSPVQA